MNVVNYNDKYISLKVCNTCNLKCKCCHNNNLKDFNYNTDIKKWINCNNIKKIKFTGGEPLLKFDIIKDIISYKYNTKPEFICVSNCTLLNKNIIDFFNNNNINIVFSYDGENKNRDYSNVKFDLLKYINNLELSVLLTEYNLYNLNDLLKDILKLKRKYNINNIYDIFYPNFTHITYNNYSYTKLKELADKYIEFICYLIDYELNIYGENKLLNILKKEFYDIKTYSNGFKCCNNNALSLNIDGSFSLCTYKYINIGNIYDGVNWKLIEKYKPKKCKECNYWIYCRNTCIMSNSEIECYIFKKLHKIIKNKINTILLE